MKIGIIGTRGIPNHYGGFEQFAEHLSYGLNRRGHDVTVYNSHLHPYQQKEWNGVRIIHCRDLEHKIGTAGQFCYDFNCINDARKRKFDVLLHLGYTSDSVWHWRWPKKTINLVNMDGLEWTRTKYGHMTQRFLKWAESLAAKNAHTMIADSPGIQNHLLTKYNKNPVYIPYGAEVFTNPDASVLDKYQLTADRYFLLIARMEPENNIEMIIRGYLSSGTKHPLFIIGNITNKYGRYITSKYKEPSLKFMDSIYDQAELDNLRYHATIYFHGHSVGGTNPSLLEAMACGCHIAIHNNQFNRAVVRDEADYFLNADEVKAIINAKTDLARIEEWRKLNSDKIRLVYNKEKIIDAYEQLMMQACGAKEHAKRPRAVEAYLYPPLHQTGGKHS